MLFHLFYLIKIQFIHWNSAKYQNVEDATGKENGIAAICLFVQVSNYTGIIILLRTLSLSWKVDSCCISVLAAEP